MQVNRENEKISVNENFILKSQNNIECKLPYLEDEQSVVNVIAKTYLTKCQSLEKEIRYEGRAIFTVVYKTEEGLKSVETGVEYGFKVQDDKILQGQKIAPSVSVKDCKVKTSNGVVIVEGILTFICEVDKCSSVEFVAYSDKYVYKNQDIEFSKNVMTIINDFKIEEEFELDYPIKNILCHNEIACTNNIDTGISCVTVEGEVELYSVVLTLNDESVKKECKTVPFRVEIEGKEILPSSISNVTVTATETNYKVLVDENKNKSVVSVEIILKCVLDVFENNLVSYASDMYSKEVTLSLTKEKVDVFKVLGQKEIKEKASGEIPFELSQNESIVCSLCENIVECETVFENNKTIVNGVVESCLLIRGENGYEKRKVNCPFIVELSSDYKYSKLLDCKISQLEVKYSKDTLKYQFILQLSFKTVEKSTCYVIIKVDETSKRQQNDSAISVYIPSEGDTMWDICKTLGVTEDVILKTNKDLQFPLSQDDRIIIYREITKG